MMSDRQTDDNRERRWALQDAALKAILAGTTWHDVAHPSNLPGYIGPAGPDRLSQLLAQRQLFAIEVDGRLLVPDYAFDSHGEVLTLVSELIQLFGDTSSQRLATWLESTSSFLDAQRPQDLLVAQPELVMAAARAHLQGPMHG